MPSVRDLLSVHGAICGDCLVNETRSRADVVYRELDAQGVMAREGRCNACAALGAVYSPA